MKVFISCYVGFVVFVVVVNLVDAYLYRRARKRTRSSAQ